MGDRRRGPNLSGSVIVTRLNTDVEIIDKSFQTSILIGKIRGCCKSNKKRQRVVRHFSTVIFTMTHCTQMIEKFNTIRTWHLPLTNCTILLMQLDDASIDPYSSYASFNFTRSDIMSVAAWSLCSFTSQIKMDTYNATISRALSSFPSPPPLIYTHLPIRWSYDAQTQYARMENAQA